MIDLATSTSPYWLWQHFQGRDFAKQVKRNVTRPQVAFGSNLATWMAAGDGDVWAAQGSVRALVLAVPTPKPDWASAAYSPPLKDGDDVYEAVAFEIQALAPIGLLEELHHSNQMSAVSPVAPFAFHANGRDLFARCATGEAIQGGWRTWYPNLPLGPLAPGLHKLIRHIKFARGAGGAFDIWHQAPGKEMVQKVFTKDLDLSHGTWPWTNVNDSPEGLYDELGCYPASNPGRTTDQNGLWHYGKRRFGSFAEAAGALGVGPTVPTTPAPPELGQIKTVVSSIQSGNKIPAHLVAWTITTDVPGRSVEWLIGGTSVFVDTQPVKGPGGFDYVYDWDASKASIGPLEVGVKTVNTDGSPGPSWPSWTIEIVAPTTPPPATPDVARAITRLRETLDLYFVGQLGYSTERAKRTRVYLALTDLNGTWR